MLLLLATHATAAAHARTHAGSHVPPTHSFAHSRTPACLPKPTVTTTCRRLPPLRARPRRSRRCRALRPAHTTAWPASAPAPTTASSAASTAPGRASRATHRAGDWASGSGGGVLREMDWARAARVGCVVRALLLRVVLWCVMLPCAPSRVATAQQPHHTEPSAALRAGARASARGRIRASSRLICVCVHLIASPFLSPGSTSVSRASRSSQTSTSCWPTLTLPQAKGSLRSRRQRRPARQPPRW